MAAFRTNKNGIMTSPATVPSAIQFDISAKHNGRTYRIYVHMPDQAAPQRGYPVLYVMDGSYFFCAAAMQAKFLAAEYGPLLVVGIGYPSFQNKDVDVMRVMDFTSAAPEGELTKGVAKYMETELQTERIAYGGCEEFFGFIKNELEPTLAAMYHTDRNNISIFGYSLGGLFCLYTLFHYPSAFRSFAAGSPSIWWNDKQVIQALPVMRQSVESGQVSPRVLITVGSLEQSTDRVPTPRFMARERVEALVRDVRAIDNARELAADLMAIRGKNKYSVEFHMFEGETHGSAVGATISRVISFVLRG